MKRITQCTLLLAATTFVLLSFKTFTASAIKGSVTPPENAELVWAINGADSLKATPEKGAFSLDVKPGTYKIVVQAKKPFKDFVKENAEVKDGETLDLGVITLQQ